MRLTVYPLEEISNLAFATLFRDPDPRVAWVTAQLVLELAIYHRPKIKKDGRRDDRVNRAARKRSLIRALRALGRSEIAPLTPLPPAWVRTPRRGWDGQLEDEFTWAEPNPFFDAQFAANVFQHSSHRSLVPIRHVPSTIATSPLSSYVAWTSERLMPSWREHGEGR